MKTITVQIPPGKKRISIIRSERNIKKELDNKKNMSKGKGENDQLTEQQPVEFIEKFVISNYNKPLEINLNKVKKDILDYEEVKLEIQKAYDKGLEDGRVSTRATLSKEFETYENWIKKIDRLSEKLHTKYKDKIKELEDSVLSLAIMVSGHIINKEIQADNNIVIDQVKEAIASVEDELVFKIKINPADKEILESVKSDLLNDKEKAEKINIIADASVDQGSCILETSAGTIDATIKTRLEKISYSLSEAVDTEIEKNPVPPEDEDITEDEDIALDMEQEAEPDEEIISEVNILEEAKEFPDIADLPVEEPDEDDIAEGNEQVDDDKS